MMKIKSFMAIMVAAVTLVLGMNSCSSDSGDESETAVANLVAGTYMGTEVLTVMGEVDESTETLLNTVRV